MNSTMRDRIPFHFKNMGSGTLWVKMAGVGGLTALVMNHYALKSESLTEASKNDVTVAVKYQLIASVLIVALPNGRPYGLSKGLVFIGTLLFCGGTYLKAFLDLSVGHVPFIGQLIYGLGWCTMILSK